MNTISAPGEAVYSTVYDYWFGFKCGTSMAAPYISGVAALISKAAPALSVSDIKDIIETTAFDLNYTHSYSYSDPKTAQQVNLTCAAGPGYDLETGYGGVDAYAAVVKALSFGKASTVVLTSSPIDMSQVVVSYVHDDIEKKSGANIAYYNRKSIKAVPVAYFNGERLIEGRDYTVAYSSPAGFRNAGKYTVTVTGCGRFSGISKYSYTIRKIPLDKSFKARGKSQRATTTLTKKYQYTGHAAKPTFKVIANAVKLKKNSDYKVSFKNNINKGKATVIITGKNNCTGKIVKTFKISGNRNFKSLKVSGLKTVKYTGKRHKPKVKLYDKKVERTLIKNIDYKASYGTNKNIGRGRIKITGLRAYKGRSKTYTFKIASSR